MTAADRWLAAEVQRTIADGPVRLELWDGRRADGAPDCAAGTCSSAIAGRSLGLAVNPNLYFGEAYMAGRLRIRGSLARGDPRAVAQQRGRIRRGGSEPRRSLARANDVAAARRNVHHHYDLGNDFYALWLDREHGLHLRLLRRRRR